MVISDLHLSDAEPVDEKRPLWKKFRRKDFFIDESFNKFLTFIQNESSGGSIELILNGDIFDFDSVMAVPTEKVSGFPSISNYERRMGMNAMEDKSTYKIDVILTDHHIWTQALANFIKNGHQVIFVIGNHDLELNWPKVQDKIIQHLHLPKKLMANIRFCEWFYISNHDTLIEHGHQYDPYCLSISPINPIIKKKGKFKVRLPFGNLANRFMVNGMGLKNPHCDDAYTKTTWEFMTFFFKYEYRNQPFMILTWFFGAFRAFFYAVGEGFLPALKDPLTIEARLACIAEKANATPGMALTLSENHAHPAVRHPLMILRELWLDRALLLLGIVWLCWQIFTTTKLFADISLWWFLVPLVASIPLFLYYAHSVNSQLHINQEKALQRAPLSARACNVQRVVNGHTHIPKHHMYSNIEYLNTGSWSPIFKGPECNEDISQKLFTWIRPSQENPELRESFLYIWSDDKIELHPLSKQFQLNNKMILPDKLIKKAS